MDHGWIVTFAAVAAPAMPQVSFATKAVRNAGPALSIEVDDVDETYHAPRPPVRRSSTDITDESWGVRRFFLRDPFGTIVNVLSHRARA